MDRKQDYTFKGFANFVIDHEKVTIGFPFRIFA